MATRTDPLSQLTPRQREVLSLVARGMTNGQIAEHLGISLDGAKWHVGEIITRLGVSSREEAAAIWRYEQRPVVRMRRWVGGLAIKPVAAAATASVVAVVGIAVVVAIAMQAGDDTPPAGNETPPAAETPTATDPVTPEPEPDTRVLLQLPTEPEIRDPDESRELGDRPASPFPDYEEGVVLYDVEAQAVRDFGSGHLPVFSTGGRWMAWISIDGQPTAGRLLVVEVPDGEVRDLGPARMPLWLDGEAVLVTDPESGSLQRVDLASGERQPADDVGEPGKEGYPASTPGGRSPIRGDLRLTGPMWQTVADDTGRPLVEFDHELVAPSPAWGGDGEVVAAIPSDDETLANLFVVDVRSREGRFVATAQSPSMIGGALSPIPLTANERYVVWTDNFCAAPEGGSPLRQTTKLFDRDSGTLIELDQRLWVEWLTPDNRLGVGLGFGAHAVIDLNTMEYEIVLPTGTANVAWSPDYRYAAHGFVGGHGGVCPP